MSYIKAEHILPEEIIREIQQYVDGKSIYIPRKLQQRKGWGSNTGIRKEIAERNIKIYEAYCNGISTQEIADEFCLSIMSIQRIIREIK